MLIVLVIVIAIVMVMVSVKLIVMLIGMLMVIVIVIVIVMLIVMMMVMVMVMVILPLVMDALGDTVSYPARAGRTVSAERSALHAPAMLNFMESITPATNVHLFLDAAVKGTDVASCKIVNTLLARCLNNEIPIFVTAKFV